MLKESYVRVVYRVHPVPTIMSLFYLFVHSWDLHRVRLVSHSAKEPYNARIFFYTWKNRTCSKERSLEIHVETIMRVIIRHYHVHRAAENLFFG